MTRTDVHAPSAIIPADYQFVAYNHMADTLGDFFFIVRERAAKAEHMARTGGKLSTHAHGGSCHICGAGARSTALFYHVPTNTYVVTGLDCADKIDSSLNINAFRRELRDAKEAQAGRGKAKLLLSLIKMDAAYEIYTAYLTKTVEQVNAASFAEQTVADIVGNVVRYGNISVKQSAYLAKLLEKIAAAPALQAQRDAEKAAAKPIPADGRITVEGAILCRKIVDTQFGSVAKILVQHADGWKVYGSLPSNIGDAEKGAIVRFDGKVEISKDDAKFGFFSRPTKAVVVSQLQVAA